ncbi:MAG: ABC transporter ATP-binding protein [Ilumatobacteraceae bacterium]
MALLEVSDLHVGFESRRGIGPWANRSILRAVDGIDLTVDRGEAIGVVGESGCGKSTLARAIVGLTEPTSGQILLDGIALNARRERADRRRIQMVFQDPSSSLNPQVPIGRMLVELLEVNGLASGAAAKARAAELLELVQLPASLLDRYPRRLSGGQRQRVGIARAIALDADVIVADEPVAALDVSVQAAVLNLLNDLRRRLGLAIVFISHDLGVVRHVCDRVAVVYLGRVVEEADRTEIFERPKHPYTQALINAVPTITSTPARLVGLTRRTTRPADRPTGCSFRLRCPSAIDRCSVDDPQSTARAVTGSPAMSSRSTRSAPTAGSASDTRQQAAFTHRSRGRPSPAAQHR